MSDTPFDDIQDARSSDYTEGWEDSEKRIIKLLEEERKRHKKEGLFTAAVYLKDLIALIKGENK
jgi:hypothetical protein